MKNVTILLAVLAIVAVSVNAATVEWKDQGVALNSWHTPGNWVDGAVPVTGDSVNLYGTTGGTAEFSTGTLSFFRINVGKYGQNDDVHLLISGGSLTGTADGSKFGDTKRPGWTINTITQTGGTASWTSGWFKMSPTASYYSPGSAEYIISGGSLSISTLKVYASRTYIANLYRYGTGRFTMDCSTTTGGPSSVTMGSWLMDASNNEFKVVLNSSGGVSTAISVTGTANFGTDNYLIVDDSAWGTKVLGQTVTLLTAGTLINNLTIVEAGIVSDNYATIQTPTSDTDWVFDTTAPSGTLRIKCTVPEPATMVLLGIGGIGVLLRRRRK